jgi:NTP pyrophosphatase (non-canonical NTP hydrolase)
MDISQLLEDAEAGRKLRDGAATDVWATIDAGFTAYQEQAQRTARTDVSFRDRLAVAALGLVGEAAEVSEAVKKHIGHGHDLDTLDMLEELGDVLWYIAELTSLLGAEMGVVASARRQAVSGDQERERMRARQDEDDQVLHRALRLLAEATATLIEQREKRDGIG